MRKSKVTFIYIMDDTHGLAACFNENVQSSDCQSG